MITLDAPHMAINSADFKGSTNYQMWNTWSNVANTVSRGRILKHTANVARSAPGGKLKNLVLNCHGSPGRIALGVGFSMPNVKMWAELAGLVDKIWINACELAATRRAGSRTDGNLFLRELSKAAKAYVVVSTDTQYTIAIT